MPTGQSRRDPRLDEVVAPAEEGKAASDRELLAQFTARQDSDAFAALVQRHGPTVLGVCRRVLREEQDAEDAFQATFLVLVRRAASIRKPERLGNWLYGVASRTARKARTQAARRRRRESEVAPMANGDPLPNLLWQELRYLLDEELQRLPANYRAPLVLCYLEGLTNEEAARRLGWPVGSMSYRLARGRELLRERLKGRQHALLSALLATLAARHWVPGQVPSRLVAATVRAAVALAHGGPAAGGSFPSAVHALAEATFPTRTAAPVAGVYLVLGAGLLALLGLGLFARAAPSERLGFPPTGSPGQAPAGHQCHAP
jgi:RNA polymerase sigma factor (sigma-70 family)